MFVIGLIWILFGFISFELNLVIGSFVFVALISV